MLSRERRPWNAVPHVQGMRQELPEAQATDDRARPPQEGVRGTGFHYGAPCSRPSPRGGGRQRALRCRRGHCLYPRCPVFSCVVTASASHTCGTPNRRVFPLVDSAPSSCNIGALPAGQKPCSSRHVNPPSCQAPEPGRRRPPRRGRPPCEADGRVSVSE